MYGVEPADVERMLQAQGGCCAICGAPNGTPRLHIDHCHKTKKIRGMLCFTCNIGIGYFKDSVVLLAAASDYLQRTK
jgi:hypothetical protein